VPRPRRVARGRVGTNRPFLVRIPLPLPLLATYIDSKSEIEFFQNAYAVSLAERPGRQRPGGADNTPTLILFVQPY
jgi:hypothetical protein